MASRFNVQFSANQRQSLDELAKELATSKTGVLKTALALLEVALRERKAGNRLGIVRDDVVVKEIIGIE